MGLFTSKQILKSISSLYPFSKTVLGVMTLASTKSQLQRWEHGCRQVVGCIPYRYTEGSSVAGGREIEVLLVSAQKKQEMLFPKGGWELHESMEDAAKRETLEEAGVTGDIETKLGKWQYTGKSNGILHEGYMFPMLVHEQREDWPEKKTRQRKWVTVAEAREACQQGWMREALDVLVSRHTHTHLENKSE